MILISVDGRRVASRSARDLLEDEAAGLVDDVDRVQDARHARPLGRVRHVHCDNGDLINEQRRTQRALSAGLAGRGSFR